MPPAEPASHDCGPPPIQTDDIGGGPDERRSEENTMKDHITIAGHDSAFAAYIARPKTDPSEDADETRNQSTS